MTGRMTDLAAIQSRFEQALALQRERRWLEAVTAYREIAKVHLTLNLADNLSFCLVELGAFDAAETWSRNVAQHRPGDAATRMRLGHVYRENRKMELAELEYRTASILAPNDPAAKVALAGLLLQTGRYAEGWPLLETRAELAPDMVPAMNASFPQWRGEPLAGKSIIILYEQGLGDQIQMARFAGALKAAGATKVSLACRPQLTALLATAPGVDAVVPAQIGQAVPIDRHDYWTRYFSAPHHLKTTLETIPRAPYLSAPPERRARWTRFGGVGLAWQASPTGQNALAKSLGESDARVLLDLGCVSLRPEDTGVSDFADTAAIIEQLDLVISIDTSVAHLTGALGKPCWTMLPRLNTDWRWLLGRSDSPWYPSMRLYRQETPGDWSGVLADIVRDLAVFRGEAA